MKEILNVSARCALNEVPLDGEGGRILLTTDVPEVAEMGWLSIQAILNAAKDAVMEPFPSQKAEMKSRKFRIVILEED